MAAINFHFVDVTLNLKQRNKLKDFLIILIKDHKYALAEIDIIFCDDAYLLNINQTFLNHDYYTDIITFPLQKNPIKAELYISVDMVLFNVKKEKQTFKNELHRVIFHGILHLIGYNDKSKKEVEKMRIMENDCLETYFS